MALFAPKMGARALQQLDQLGKVGDRFGAYEQMDVGRNDPHLENLCGFPGRHGTQESTEKAGQAGVN